MKTNKMEKAIFVFENWTSDPKRIGKIYYNVIRGREQFSFEYDSNWLENPLNQYYLLDPDLNFYSGRQYPLNKTMFGLFADSCPDRWGRLLMKRRETIQARQEERKPKSLSDFDFLLGVFDEARMGAIRFRLDPNGSFISTETDFSIPPWISLRELEDASWKFENDKNIDNQKWLKQLLAPGSSLGGSRPKATIKDENGSLWIAKFPSRQDEINKGAWEMVVHELARECALNTPDAKVITFSKNGSTFLSKRFDRIGSQRIHFASALTLLRKTDGASAADGTSYLDLVSFISSNGASPRQDLLELWRRIVFSMAVSNTDDHLRNHGFILSHDGWRLSPLYDVNPVPFGDRLAININENDNLISIDLAVEAAPYFGLSKNEANKAAREIVSIVQSKWERTAVQQGLNRASIETMRPAFSLKN